MKRTLAAALTLTGLLLTTACGQQAPGGGGTGGEDAAYPGGALELIAPAAPGGGWDSTARGLAEAMEAEDLASNVQVVNVAGAGGTIGLSQFAGETDPQTLMVAGATLVGAIETNSSEATLDDVTPIARLTEEYHILVVPADSPYQTIEDLAEAMRADLGSVAIAGGSAGGTDQITAGLMAEEFGVDPAGVNYVAFSGGGESLAAILGGQVAAGISNIQEYAGQVESGDLRALAITAPERVEGLDAPTFTEAGYDVTFANWRCVLAPAGMTDEQITQITDFLDEVHGSAAWEQALEDNAWGDAYLTGPEFVTFLDEQETEIRDTLTEIGLVQ
jgi:putative tricarboxylic transport membrane protein